jgi:uncharacterized protein (DUF362 family)
MTTLINSGKNQLIKSIHEILDTFFESIDWKRGIFIKPNIVFPVKPTSGEITSPKLVKALILTLRERYNNIDIIMGEGVAAGCKPLENFSVSGYTKLANELQIPLLDLNRVERKPVEWKFGKLEIPYIALERVYINLPILKYSSACVISGALKNQKGLLLPKSKKQFHRLGLHEQIAELNAVIRPSLTILDCTRFLGRNALISGDNCGEIDALVCQLLGIDEPEHVRLSRNAKVFSNGYSIIGDKLQPKQISKRPEVKEFKRLGRLRLWSNPQACTMCRYLFTDVQQNFYKVPYLLAVIKLLIQSIRGAEVLIGSNPRWRKEYKTVICVGVCTRNLAKEGSYIYIHGCPPTLNDLIDNLP